MPVGDRGRKRGSSIIGASRTGEILGSFYGFLLIFTYLQPRIDKYTHFAYTLLTHKTLYGGKYSRITHIDLSTIMLVIRLQRIGKKKQPTYRFVINEKTRDTQAKSLEILGEYNPVAKEKVINLKEDRIKHWLSQGAQTSATVHNLLVKAGLVEGKSRDVVTISNKRQGKLNEKKAAAEEKKRQVEEAAKAAKEAEAAAKAEAEASKENVTEEAAEEEKKEEATA